MLDRFVKFWLAWIARQPRTFVAESQYGLRVTKRAGHLVVRTYKSYVLEDAHVALEFQGHVVLLVQAGEVTRRIVIFGKAI